MPRKQPPPPSQPVREVPPGEDLGFVCGWLVREAQDEVNRRRESVVGRMRQLADNLTRSADRLTENPLYDLNSSGEVQGRGLDIDLDCAKLEAARRNLLSVSMAVEQFSKHLPRLIELVEPYQRREALDDMAATLARYVKREIGTLG